MRRFWWPEPLYEARPYGALTLGLLAGAISLARSLAVGNWEPPFVATLVVSGVVMIYGGVVLQMRHGYRRRSRWNLERRH
jgi:hypothetical protein